jgi:excisionase family DNA binding protein
MEGRNSEVLTLADVAARLGVCVATVRRMIDPDRLPARRVGRQYRIPVEAFERWIEQLDVRVGS